MSSNGNLPFSTCVQCDENESKYKLERNVDASSDSSRQSRDREELFVEGISLTEESQSDMPDEFSSSNKISKVFCCGQYFWKVTEPNDTENYPHPFGCCELIPTLVSLPLFFFDVISDIMLACEYYKLARLVAFGFTVAFIVIPLLVVNLTSLLWYGIGFLRERITHLQTSRLVWVFRIILTFPLLMGPVVRHIEYIYHGWQFRRSCRTEKRKKHYNAMLHEDTNAAMLRMFEAFLESAPQLVLQLYITLTETSNEGLLMRKMRVMAMVGSCIGVSWSLVSYYKALRASRNDNEVRQSLFGQMLYFIWRACEVGSRILVLALFASHCTYWMLVVVAVHWIIMFACVLKQNPDLCEKPCDKIVFHLLICFVMVFCFQNVKNGPSGFRQLVYYFVFYAENIAMLVLWSYFTSAKSEWYYFIAIGVVPGTMLLHICVQMIYYRCFHPKGQHEVELETTPDNIERGESN